MIQVGTSWLFAVAALVSGVGFTLLKYSRDGDLDHRAKYVKNEYANPLKTTEKEAWIRLNLLANASATEITWNTSLFVAIVSSFVFMGLLSHARGNYVAPLQPTTSGILWILSLLTVFGLQDVVIRWKSAHRKHANAAEQTSIIERLRWMNESNHASSVLTKANAPKAHDYF
jgi:hypothetical protein